MGAMLDGTLSIEVGRTRAAAFAGKLLADAGGEVIALADAARSTSLSRAARTYMDAGKDVVTWREDGDAVMVRELLPHADLFVTDLDAVELARRGLDWPTLHALAPRLCYVWLAPVGHVGEERTSNAGELAMQAISGLMHVVGHPDREPLALPYSLGSVQLGLHGAAAATAALQAAAATGVGRLVEVSGAEVLASYVRIYGAVASYYGVPLRRDGRRAPGSGGRWPFGIFPCKDGYVAMICRSSREFDSLLEMMGNPSWTQQERYRDLYAMAISYPDEIDALVTPWLMEHTRDELLELAHRFAVPVAPVRNVAEVLADPQLRDARHFFDQMTTASGEVLQIPGRPWASGPRVLVEREPSVADAMIHAGAAVSALSSTAPSLED
jgi:crotonobetainyl-CoA:carnitine CoA-transferase CaiB-like acyl-CoA transferase